MDTNETEIAVVPMACYEAAQYRFKRIVRYIAFGWASSVAVLGAAAAYILLA